MTTHPTEIWTSSVSFGLYSFCEESNTKERDPEFQAGLKPTTDEGHGISVLLDVLRFLVGE